MSVANAAAITIEAEPNDMAQKSDITRLHPLQLLTRVANHAWHSGDGITVGDDFHNVVEHTQTTSDTHCTPQKKAGSTRCCRIVLSDENNNAAINQQQRQGRQDDGTKARRSRVQRTATAQLAGATGGVEPSPCNRNHHMPFGGRATKTQLSPERRRRHHSNSCGATFSLDHNSSKVLLHHKPFQNP